MPFKGQITSPCHFFFHNFSTLKSARLHSRQPLGFIHTIMAKSLKDDIGDSTHSISSNNRDIMTEAGKVHMDEAHSWGTGIIGDFKRTVGTHWVAEMTNFNQKTIAVTLLVFISVISPTLTFGAVYGKETDNLIGAVETILATAWVGVFYALVGGMPLVSNVQIDPTHFWFLNCLSSQSFNIWVLCTVHHWFHRPCACIHKGRCANC